MRRPRHRAYHPTAEINIANLVDVVLVVLIIFMISAPLLQSSIEINLPKTSATVLQDDDDFVVLTVDAKGGLYINDIFANPSQFEQRLKDELARKRTNTVYFRGDSTIAYGSAITVIGRLKQMGIESIGLVTQQIDEKKTRSRR